MNKKEEQLLRESIRQILAREALEEGKFTDWVADRVGIPREPSLADMTPTGKYKSIIRLMDLYTLQQDYKTLYGSFRAAQGRGRSSHEVQSAIKDVRDYIIYQLSAAGVNGSTAAACAAEFIKSAETKAHGDMHRDDAAWERSRARAERLGLKEGADPSGGDWAAYITPDGLTGVLYRGGVFQESLDSWRARKGDAPFIKASGFYQTKVVAGVIQLVQPGNPCHGAYEIGYVAGPGKPLTSLGYHMSPSGRLIMDRRPGKVSGDAVRSWVGAFGKTQNFPLDNIESPKTPEPEDDCDFQDLPDPLNYAYGGDPSIGSRAVSLHSAIESQLSPEERDSLRAGLEESAEAFWDANYKG
jgi:hypothetical protein